MPRFMVDFGNSNDGPIGATLHVAGVADKEEALFVARKFLGDFATGVDLDCDDTTGVRDACVYFNDAQLTLDNVYDDPDGGDDDDDDD